MDFVKSTFVSPREASLGRCQRVQWYASQFSLSWGLLYLSFGSFFVVKANSNNLPEFFGGIGLYTGVISAVVSGLGAAAVAPRPGANWQDVKWKIFATYAIASVISLIACTVQIALATYIIISRSEIFTNSKSFYLNVYWVDGHYMYYHGIFVMVSLFGMILTGAINLIADVTSCYHSIKLVRNQ